MKNLLFILLFAPSLVGNSNLTAISQALNSGNVDELSKYFDETVEIAVLNEEDIFSKAEAKSVIQKFFKDHQPKSFSQVHQGASKGDSKYCIGNLVTGDSSYKVYLYMKEKGGKSLIQVIRIDK